MCIKTRVIEHCKSCTSQVEEYLQIRECSHGPCLQYFMEDGNNKEPPKLIYTLCGRCVPKVREELAKLDRDIEDLQSDLHDVESELETASHGDDYAYVVRCQEDIRHIKDLMDENELRKADLEISLQCYEDLVAGR